MTDQDGGARPASDRPATLSIVERRRASRELDALLGVGRTDHTTPDWDDYGLGIPERRARGIELREVA